MNSLAHAHYYPCSRYQAFIFRASVRPFRCVHEKLGLGTRLLSSRLQPHAGWRESDSSGSDRRSNSGDKGSNSGDKRSGGSDRSRSDWRWGGRDCPAATGSASTAMMWVGVLAGWNTARATTSTRHGIVSKQNQADVAGYKKEISHCYHHWYARWQLVAREQYAPAPPSGEWPLLINFIYCCAINAYLKDMISIDIIHNVYYCR